METANRVLQLLDELEESSDAALKELLAAKQDIEQKLARIQEKSSPKPKKKKTACGVCHSTDHNSRFHKENPA